MMKRDMDLLRSLLLEIESCNGPHLESVPEIEGFDDEVVVEHVRLAQDAGFIVAIDASSYERRNYLNLQMTWAGHEFLENIRDPKIWSNTKDGAKRVGSWSVKLLAEMAAGYAKAQAAQLGIPLA